MENQICGIINIYKEKGFTSHDVVNVVRKTLNRAKTGHTGTLDPDAEGVLPICVGKATKLASYIAADKKQYRAVMRLGITTTTEDISGEVLTSQRVDLKESEVISAIRSFIGEYEQKPPMYSAIKVNGKKLYEYAREGKEVERKTRLIKIFDISDIRRLTDESYSFLVDCSKGTYIRTLCSDIGAKLGCGGCMAELVRTKSGDFELEKAVKLDELKGLVEEGRLNEVLISPSAALSDYKVLKAKFEAEKYVRNGNPLLHSMVEGIEKADIGDRVVINDYQDNIIGVYEMRNEVFKPVTMLI